MNARTLPNVGNPMVAIQPPHSIEAEHAVLGGLLIAGVGALDRIEGVMTAADFYRDDHRRIFSAMKALGDSGKPVDVVMVAEALQNLSELESVGGLSYIVALASNTPSAANLHRYAEIVREKSIMRGLHRVATRMEEACMSPGPKDVEKIASEAELSMAQLLDRQGGEPMLVHDASGRHSKRGMGMAMIKTSVTGGRETAKKLRGTGVRARDVVRKTVGRLTLELLVKVKQEKLSGQVLNVRTGRLRRSITQRVTVTGSEVEGIVGTNVEYGKFHEFGQSIKDDLKKQRDGFNAGLKADKPALSPDSLPPRSFLRSVLKEMEPRIRDEFAHAVKESSTTWRLL